MEEVIVFLCVLSFDVRWVMEKYVCACMCVYVCVIRLSEMGVVEKVMIFLRVCVCVVRIREVGGGGGDGISVCACECVHVVCVSHLIHVYVCMCIIRYMMWRWCVYVIRVVEVGVKRVRWGWWRRRLYSCVGV